MELLNQYFELQKKIFQYFEYNEDWKVIPLEDRTEFHWFLRQNEEGAGRVYFAPKPIDLDVAEKGEELYSDIIYTQRFLPKWVYRGENFTMISVDTRVDGNKFLAVYDNNLEMKNLSNEIKQALQSWDF